MSLYIESLDGVSYDLEWLGLTPLSFKVNSLSTRSVSENLDGVDGFLDIETSFEGRTMKASFLLKGRDVDDYIKSRKTIYKLFDGKTYFYVIDKNDSGVLGNRWKVKTSSPFDLERINPTTGKFEIEFISESPYSESYISTLSPYNLNINYTFTTNTFSVWNEGDIVVDPRVFPLVINYKGASTNLIIRNLTTGDEWQYTGTTISTDNIKLDGIRTLKNDISVFKDTNRKLITLTSGNNDFELVGTTSPFEISFDFRYYYI